jgi:hypothetical protein
VEGARAYHSNQRVLTSVPWRQSVALRLRLSVARRSAAPPVFVHFIAPLQHDHHLVPSPRIIASVLLISTPTLSTGRRCA